MFVGNKHKLLISLLKQQICPVFMKENGGYTDGWELCNPEDLEGQLAVNDTLQ